MKKNWYAVFTRMDCEKKVADQLRKRRVQYYLPFSCNSQEEVPKGRELYKPLFPSCVFVRTTRDELANIKRLQGVISLLYWLNKPAIITDEEMEELRHFLSECKTVFLKKIAVDARQHGGLNKTLMQHTHGEHLNSAEIKLILPSLGYVLTTQNPQTRLIDLVLEKELMFHNGALGSLN